MRPTPLQVLALAAGWALAGCAPAASGGRSPAPASRPADKQTSLRRSAERMIKAGRGHLAPVYAPLAEQIAADLHLARKSGVGIDLGSGPGTLIVELCKRTQLHWINADINPYFFGPFLALAEARGVGGRVSAVLADAQNLPFRDDYADVVVSRGSYHFWPDLRKALAEIYRVLKPGGVAYIGRGFSRNLPLKTAKAIRRRQGKPMRYDRQAQAAAFRKIMAALGVTRYRIHMPTVPGGENVNYGIWIEFHKPAR